MSVPREPERKVAHVNGSRAQDGAREPAVLARVEGRLGRITLNRPAAINALTHEMVVLIASALDAWRDDDVVETVLLDGAGERGFCAGGDVVALARSGAEADAFWRAEYRLNATIARYPKPVVAFMDGLVLGGGVGLACHASHRLVTERSKVGLPETGIGFLPDVGATWLLSRAPGELGLFAALTNRMLTPPEAIELGLADDYVERDDLELLAISLRDAPPDEVLRGFALAVLPSGLLDQREWIDWSLAGDDLSEMLRRLDAGDDEAHEAGRVIRSKSPTASAVTIAALRSAVGAASLEDALVTELRTAVRLAEFPDFAEGVRAQLVDKDRSPRWAAQADDIPGFLAPLARDLTFDGKDER
jgi:enoyl-CoA hydratase